MDRAEFMKRLSKCSKDSIMECIYSEFMNEIILRKIEAIEFENKSEELLAKIAKNNDLMVDTKTDTPEGLKEWFSYQEEWKKANKELDKLYNWFSSRGA